MSENVVLIQRLKLRHISQGEGEQDFSLPTQTRGGSLMHIHASNMPRPALPQRVDRQQDEVEKPAQEMALEEDSQTWWAQGVPQPGMLPQETEESYEWNPAFSIEKYTKGKS